MKGFLITRAFDRADCPQFECDFELSGDWFYVVGECQRNFSSYPEWSYQALEIESDIWAIWQTPISEGAQRIASERIRQVIIEGWDAESDDRHEIGEICSAAACYLFAGDCLANAKRMNARYSCTPESLKAEIQDNNIGIGWPWDMEWLKIDPDPVRSLVKAGALIAAEIDRLQRQNAGGSDA